MPEGRPVFVAIVGRVGSGKTTRAIWLAASLAALGVRVGGVVQEGLSEDGRRTGFVLVDIATGERVPFARRETDGSLSFERTGWEWAAERILRARREMRVVVVDEIGLIEADGGGHLPALLRPLPGECATLHLLAVRDIALPGVRTRLGEPDAVVSAEGPAEDALAIVCAALDRGPRSFPGRPTAS